MGPKLTQGEDGKYSISLEFIKGMLEWYKTGKPLPKRFVEIALPQELSGLIDCSSDTYGKSFWVLTSNLQRSRAWWISTSRRV